MNCRQCGEAFGTGANFCHHCGAERVVYCVECGTSLSARADSCPLCRRPQPGSAAQPSAAPPLYRDPQGIFNITVPSPWEVTEPNIYGPPCVSIDRADVRSGGFLPGLFQNFMSIGPAGLQIWVFSLKPGSDFVALNQAYIYMQSEISAHGGGGGGVGSLTLAAAPANQYPIQFGSANGVVLDYHHSAFGMTETTERRFLALLQTPEVALGVVMVTSAPPQEFAQWERAIWDIASSLRFGKEEAGAESAGVNHLPTLRVGAVDTALDWAWIFDVGQGDFTAARDAAEQALKEHRDADTLFARAVVHQLQGEFDAALALFEEAFAMAPDDGRRYIIAALARLAEYQPICVLPDGDSVIFVEAQQLLGKSTEATEWMRRGHEAGARMDTQHEQLGGGYVLHILTMVATWRNLLLISPEQMRAEQLRNFDQQLAGWEQAARAAGEGRLSRSIFGLRVELMAAAGRAAEALHWLGALTKAHCEADDVAGAMWCLLFRGDMLASPPPLGRPTLFGYVIREQMTNTTTLAVPAMFDRSRIDLGGARSCYEEARSIYEEAGAMRGVGLALLRLAYLDAMDNTRGWAHAVRGYSEAQDIFKAVGDRKNEWLARAGQLWARLGAGEAGLRDVARPLAEEIKAGGALTWGISLGLAFAYAGREALTVRGDVEAATRASRVAEVFFEVFDAPLKRAQACNDRADAWVTLEVVEKAELEWDSALNWLEYAAQRPHPDAYSVNVRGVQLAGDLVRLYTGRWDAEGLERAGAHAHTFCVGVPRVTDEEITRLMQAASVPQETPQESAQAVAAGGAKASLVQSYMERMAAKEVFARMFTPYMIHEIMRLIEQQLAVFVPLSRGKREMENAREESAGRFFSEALRAADELAERDFLRAIVFAYWRKRDEARAAVARYLADDMPHSSRTTEGLQLGMAPEVNPALTETLPRIRELNMRMLLVSALVNVEAWAEAREQFQEIERLAGSPLRLSAPVAMREEILVFTILSLVADGLGERESALAYSAQAVEALEVRRRYLRQENVLRALGGQRTTIGTYADRARLLAARGDWEQAFAVAEMTRARVLAESLGSARAVTKQLKMAEAYRQYTEQMAAVERLTTQLATARGAKESDPEYVATLEQQLIAATSTLDASEEALSRSVPQWRELSAPRADILSVAQVAERLPPGTLLLAYMFFDKYLLSWAVTREGLVGHELVTEFEGQQFRARPFAARTRAWVRQFSGLGDDKNEDVPLSPNFESALATALLGRYDDAIATAEHLLFVPFAELNMLPFQALPWRGRALGLQKPISYLPAASLLQYFRQPDSQAVGALVVGDPEAMSYMDATTGRVETLDPLPAARLEAQAVAALYGAQPLVGAEATEQAVRVALKRAPRLIHFATHGFLQEDAPLASGVALAGGEAIAVDELMGIELKADVVVFSACDTGRGRLQGSELIGLARGLLYAGARAAVVSLWPVDDVATAMLMEFFHTELAAQVSPARALWQAQLRLQQTTAGEAAPCYTRAAAAYADTISALTASGRVDAARHFQQELSKLESRAKLSRRFPTQQLFTAPSYWAAFQVIGDWR